MTDQQKPLASRAMETKAKICPQERPRRPCRLAKTKGQGIVRRHIPHPARLAPTAGEKMAEQPLTDLPRRQRNCMKSGKIRGLLVVLAHFPIFAYVPFSVCGIHAIDQQQAPRSSRFRAHGAPVAAREERRAPGGKMLRRMAAGGRKWWCRGGRAGRVDDRSGLKACPAGGRAARLVAGKDPVAGIPAIPALWHGHFRLSGSRYCPWPS